MAPISSTCLECELRMEFDETAMGTDMSCAECDHEQIALPDSVRSMLGLVADVQSSYCKELATLCPRIDLEYRWAMTIEVASYILLVLDLAMFHDKQAAVPRQIINRFAEQVVLPFEDDRFSKAIEHRLAAYGRALSGKPLPDGITECHAIFANYLLAAPKSLHDVPTGDIPLHVVGATSGFQLRSALVGFESTVLASFRRALRNVFSHSNDITHLPGQVIDELVDSAYDDSP